MADSTYVFVNTSQQLEAFIEDLARLIELSFERKEKARDIWYDFDSEQMSIWVYKHEYESDEDLPLAEYPIAIDIRAKFVQAGIGKRVWQDEQARNIFNKLKATKKYPLLLCWGLQTIMETFDPTQTETKRE